MTANRDLDHIRPRGGVSAQIWSDISSSRRKGHDRVLSTASQPAKADVTVLSTISVFDTTIIQTALVTMRLSSISNRSSAASLTSSCKLPSTTHVKFPDFTATHVESVASTPPPRGITYHENTAPSTSRAARTTTTMPPDQAAYNTSEISTSKVVDAQPNGLDSQASKRAIIGGLSGAIGGLLLIGVMIFFFLRRKRLKDEARNSRDYNEHLEKQSYFQTSPRPPPAFSSRCESLQTVGRPSSSPPAVDQDHGIIRMSTQHWPRPYAPGGAEGHRTSRSITQLRVTNPDPSRPTTARRPSQETARTYLSRKRSAFGEALHEAATRLRASSFRTEISAPPPPVPLPPDHIFPNRDKPLPAIQVNDRGSMATSYTPSFNSYPSLVFSTRPPPSVPFAGRPQLSPNPARSPSRNYIPSPYLNPSTATNPEGDSQDRFKTPPLNTPAPSRSQRPSLTTIQRLWPHSRPQSSKSTQKTRKSPHHGSTRSSLLTPSSFTRLSSHRRSQRWSRGGKAPSSRGMSGLLVETPTTGRWSRRSDPFDLDRGSWRGGRGSLGFGAAVREAARGTRGGMSGEANAGVTSGTSPGVYEGT